MNLSGVNERQGFCETKSFKGLKKAAAVLSFLLIPKVLCDYCGNFGKNVENIYEQISSKHPNSRTQILL